VRAKDAGTNDGGGAGSDEDASCGNVFGAPDGGMEFSASHIAEELDGGVEGFGDPDDANGGDHPAPFGEREMKRPSGGEHEDCRHGVGPSVAL